MEGLGSTMLTLYFAWTNWTVVRPERYKESWLFIADDFDTSFILRLYYVIFVLLMMFGFKAVSQMDTLYFIFRLAPQSVRLAENSLILFAAKFKFWLQFQANFLCIYYMCLKNKTSQYGEIILLMVEAVWGNIEKSLWYKNYNMLNVMGYHIECNIWQNEWKW